MSGMNGGGGLSGGGDGHPPIGVPITNGVGTLRGAAPQPAVASGVQNVGVAASNSGGQFRYSGVSLPLLDLDKMQRLFQVISRK